MSSAAGSSYPFKRRLLLWGAGLLLFALVVATAIYFRFALPVGDGPAGPGLAKAAFSAPWSQRPVFVVGLGDSVTAGFGARKGYSYFDRVVAVPPEDPPEIQGLALSAVLPQLRHTNLAISGSTSSEVLKKQLPLLPVAASNVFGVVLLTTGGNDLIHHYGRTPPREEAMYGATWADATPWVANFERRLERILEEIAHRFPGGYQVFMGNIYDPSDGIGDLRKAGLPPWPDGLKILAAYNATIAKVVARHSHAHLVNLHDTFLGHGLYCTQFWRPHYRANDPHYWYFTNLEDPNERGYDAIRRLFLLQLADQSGGLAVQRHPQYGGP